MISLENRVNILKIIKVQVVSILVFVMLTNSLVYASSDNHVIYKVTWLSDNSAKITLDWSNEDNDTPIMITGWSVNDNGTVTILYNQGENITQGFESRTVTDEEMECPCIFVLTENVRESESQKFPDLPDSLESSIAINHLYDLGIINGYPDGSFKPEGHVTRAEFSKMLYVAGDMILDMDSPITFTDVTESHWAEPYIYTLASKEIVNGKGEGIFDPEGTITIGEVMAILDRSFELSGDYGAYDEPLKGHWSDASFGEMVNKGIVQPTDAFYLPYSPDVLATRQDCTLLLSRVLRTYYQMN